MTCSYSLRLVGPKGHVTLEEQELLVATVGHRVLHPALQELVRWM